MRSGSEWLGGARNLGGRRCHLRHFESGQLSHSASISSRGGACSPHREQNVGSGTRAPLRERCGVALSGLEALGTLEAVVATSDILKADNSAIPLRSPAGAARAVRIASKTSEVARAHRSGSGAEWFGGLRAALRRANILVFLLSSRSAQRSAALPPVGQMQGAQAGPRRRVLAVREERGRRRATPQMVRCRQRCVGSRERSKLAGAGRTQCGKDASGEPGRRAAPRQRHPPLLQGRACAATQGQASVRCRNAASRCG